MPPEIKREIGLWEMCDVTNYFTIIRHLGYSITQEPSSCIHLYPSLLCIGLYILSDFIVFIDHPKERTGVSTFLYCIYVIFTSNFHCPSLCLGFTEDAFCLGKCVVITNYSV